MSDTDSFIEEVTEEVRRDKLFGFIRKYGWIPATAVVLLVGGAAFNEYRKATARTAAQGLGDALLNAVEAETAEDRFAALNDVATDGEASTVVGLLRAGLGAEVDRAAALAALRDIVNSPDAGPVYKQLAELKLLMMEGGDRAADDRIAAYETLAAPGAPFRSLALEQKALVLVEIGQSDAAITLLNQLIAEDGTTAGLRQRASQLIVSLGGTLEDG